MKGSIRQRSAGTTLLAGVAASTLTWPLAHALATGSGRIASTIGHTVRPWPWWCLRMQSTRRGIPEGAETSLYGPLRRAEEAEQLIAEEQERLKELERGL